MNNITVTQQSNAEFSHQPAQEKHFCVYCGQEAHHQFKNGKWCCCDSTSKCSSLKQQQSQRFLKIHQIYKEQHGTARFSKGICLSQTNKKYRPKGEHICVYCGGHAEYKLKDGRWCCAPIYNQCSMIKNKLSTARKKAHAQKPIWYHNGHKSWNKGLTAETDKRVAKHSQTLKQKYSMGELVPHWKGKHHSEESKQKISQIMKRKILSGEIEVPYLRNHHSKGPSYPEQYFIETFKNANLNVEHDLQVGLYELDFANPKTKKYVEIDGEQHYVDPRIVKHDSERTEALKQQGWQLVSRVRWSEFQKMTLEERQNTCNNLIDELR